MSLLFACTAVALQAGAAPCKVELNQPPGPCFCQLWQAGFLAVLHLNSCPVITPSGTDMVDILWGAAICCLQLRCRGEKPALDCPSNLPLCAGAELWLMLKPSSVRCSLPPPAMAREQLSSEGCTAPWALLHGCYGTQFSPLFLICCQVNCYLSAGLVSKAFEWH